MMISMLNMTYIFFFYNCSFFCRGSSYRIHRSVNQMFSLYFDFVLILSRFGVEGWIWVQIVSVPGFCLLFAFFRLVQ